MKLLDGFNRFGQNGIISSILNKFNILFQCINIAEKKLLIVASWKFFFNPYFHAVSERFDFTQFMLHSFYLCCCKIGFTYMDGAGVGYVNQLCLKQGDQVILNLVFILETVIRIILRYV